MWALLWWFLEQANSTNILDRAIFLVWQNCALKALKVSMRWSSGNSKARFGIELGQLDQIKHGVSWGSSFDPPGQPLTHTTQCVQLQVREDRKLGREDGAKPLGWGLLQEEATSPSHVTSYVRKRKLQRKCTNTGSCTLHRPKDL